MVEIVCVRGFYNKILYYLSPNSLQLENNDDVIFETGNGVLYGTIVGSSYLVDENNVNLPLFNVIRKVTDADFEIINSNFNKSQNALLDAKKISNDLNLEMHFIDSYFYFDTSQLIFNFVSDVRVDFRELAKRLASKYKTRIELRQVGVRDKAKKVGGIGPCGLFLCCNSFLSDFNSVSINMAKNQMLALNPSKINGICGRLLCCLSFENDTYFELKKSLPKLGSYIETSIGIGKVIAIDIFKQSYKVDCKERGIIEISQCKEC